MEYNNYEAYSFSDLRFNYGIPLRSYPMVEVGFPNIPVSKEIVYDVLTKDRKVLRAVRFIPFAYKNLYIDIKLLTVEDFESQTNFYSSANIYDIDNLDFTRVLLDIASYSSSNQKDYIPEVVMIITFPQNFSLIFGSIVPTMSFLGDRKNIDATNPTPTTLDTSLSSKNYSRILAGNASIVIDNSTGEITISNVGGSNISINSSKEVSIISKSDVNIKSSGNINIVDSNSINIGSSNASHPAVLGDTLENQINTFITTVYNKHTHTVSGSSTGAPSPSGQGLDGTEKSSHINLDT